MRNDLTFTAASEIINANCHYKEDQGNVQAEFKRAKDAEYHAHIKKTTWKLTPLPTEEGSRRENSISLLRASSHRTSHILLSPFPFHPHSKSGGTHKPAIHLHN